jgi:C4-type Zn-finger protein
VVEKWLDYVKTVPGNLKEMRVECVSCMAPIEFRLAIPHREPNSLETDLYCQKCAYERGLILQGNKGGENIG